MIREIKHPFCRFSYSRVPAQRSLLWLLLSSIKTSPCFFTGAEIFIPFRYLQVLINFKLIRVLIVFHTFFKTTSQPNAQSADIASEAANLVEPIAVSPF